MDKDSHQAYEFIPSTNNGTEQEQFFIVQDDGTFLMNRQVQFVAQVPDGVQSCTVYDVSQQQYFVDVDNSAELISVPDNFILPITEGSSNLYGNSYLLQAVPTTNNDQIEDVVVEQYKQTSSPNEADVDDENKQDSSCTEITLSDEQYKMLEQKGWVLLETNNKVFILDGVGLHEITSNNKLIYQLKTESQNPDNLEIDSTRCSKTTIKLDDSTQNSSNEHDSVEFVIENSVPNIEDQKPEISFDCVEKEEIISVKPETLDPQNDTKSEKSLKSEPPNTKDQIPLRLQSKYFLKDLPDKIVLGKTVNGKNLVAKVVKSSDCHKITPVEKPNQPEEPKIRSDENAIKILKTENDPIENLIQKALHSEIKCSSDQVEAAKEVVIQLVLMSNFQPSVVGRNLVVTKEVNKMVDGKEISLVTGRVETSTKPKNGQWQFKYIPDLLQKLMTESVSKYSNIQESDSNARSKYRSEEDYQYLHIHIIERLRPDKIETVSITLHKRYLPIKSAIENIPMNAKNRQSSRLYACSSCASVFKTESELTEHQETQCMYMEAEDTLTIDTEKITKDFDSVEVNPYYVMKTSKGTEYVCLQCSLSFNKFGNCQRHIKTHLRPKCTSDSKTVKQKEENVEEPILYKCKMCSSSYFHSATLSKHIIKAHIRNNNKLSV